MEHLPPVGWADVATKRDLDALKAGTKRDLNALEARMDAGFDRLRLEMHREINRLLLLLFPTLVTVVGVTFAGGRAG